MRTRNSAVDVDAALAHLGIVLAAADEVEPPGRIAVVDGLVITVRRAVSVEVRVDDRAGVLGLEGDRFVVTAVLGSMGAALADSAAAGAVLYLTFDDGPHPTYTPQVLDLRAAYGARATFFVLGSEVVQHPGVAARIVGDGHAIGNHTWSHARLPGLSTAALTREVVDTQDAIAAATGTRPACLRPLYGDRDDAVTARVTELGLRMVLWDLDPRDWERPGTAAIVDHVLARARPGSAVLLHDGRRDRQQTVAATAQLLAALTGQGYQLRALPGC